MRKGQLGFGGESYLRLPTTNIVPITPAETTLQDLSPDALDLLWEAVVDSMQNDPQTDEEKNSVAVEVNAFYENHS